MSDTKVFDETWEAASHEHFDSAKARWDHDVVVKGTDRSVWSGWTDEADQVALDRCHLAAAAPELYRALLAVEWSGEDGGGYLCPSCKEGKDHRTGEGHAADCALSAALAKARGESK